MRILFELTLVIFFIVFFIVAGMAVYRKFLKNYKGGKKNGKE